MKYVDEFSAVGETSIWWVVVAALIVVLTVFAVR